MVTTLIQTSTSEKGGILKETGIDSPSLDPGIIAIHRSLSGSITSYLKAVLKGDKETP